MLQDAQTLLAAVWSYKLSLAPVALTYLIFELPALARRVYRLYYLPIYFMFFPLGHSDHLYAQYFNEDTFYGEGRMMTAAEKAALRIKIRNVAIISMIFSTVVAPWLCGAVASTYLTSTQFTEFFWSLLFIKSVLICISLYNIRQTAWFVQATHTFKWVLLLYVAYLFAISLGVSRSFELFAVRMANMDFLTALFSLRDYLYFDVFLNIFVVSALTYVVTNNSTDPKFIPPDDPDEPYDDVAQEVA